MMVLMVARGLYVNVVRWFSVLGDRGMCCGKWRRYVGKVRTQRRCAHVRPVSPCAARGGIPPSPTVRATRRVVARGHTGVPPARG